MKEMILEVLYFGIFLLIIGGILLVISSYYKDKHPSGDGTVLGLIIFIVGLAYMFTFVFLVLWDDIPPPPPPPPFIIIEIFLGSKNKRK